VSRDTLLTRYSTAPIADERASMRHTCASIIHHSASIIARLSYKYEDAAYLRVCPSIIRHNTQDMSNKYAARDCSNKSRHEAARSKPRQLASVFGF
jgi:hypothetical protein